MPQTHKTSLLIALALIFLLPIFFIPGGALNLSIAKSALLVLGVLSAVLVFLSEIWREGKLNIPWHPFVLLAALLPLVYLLSALLSTPSSLSLLGYSFEVGTFGYMLLGSIFLVLTGILFTDNSRALQALVAFFISISVVALFVTLKIIFGLSTSLEAGGDVLVWGNFFGNMGNPIGNWTDLAVSFGLLSILAALSIGMIPMKLSLRVLVYGAFTLATILLAIINFSIAFVLTLGASVLLVLYFLKMEKHFLNTLPDSPQISTRFFRRPVFLPVVLGLVSLIFLVNPTISASRATLGDLVANLSRVENLDVRPSLSATLGISKAALSQDGFLGSGPNTFERDWLTYKPVDVNTTPFWAVAFPFGASFVSTQIASTGVLGTASWLAFFVLLILLGIKALSHVPESRAERFSLVSALLVTLFLWVSSFLYTPSVTVLMFAFVFSGLLVAVSRGSGIISSRVFALKESKQARVTSLLFGALVVLGVIFLGWAGFDKTASAFYFKKAVNLSNTEGSALVDIENQLNRALVFAPADIHYVALSRINFAKAQVVANSTTGAPEENRAIFEEALRKSIEAARNAVGANPAGYQNWISLGIVYSALVPPPLAVAGAYENALLAYSEANKRNPLNPEVPLFLAQLELNNGDPESARSFIRSAIALKEDYADAYLMLARLEVKAGNTAEAAASAERLSLLTPNNPGIRFELGLLKYSNKDYLGALNAFNSALVSAPDYANAKYYLGLTLAQLGQLDKALEQFETLAITNPDSEEVKSIIRDLRAGKDSFLDN